MAATEGSPPLAPGAGEDEIESFLTDTPAKGAMAGRRGFTSSERASEFFCGKGRLAKSIRAVVAAQAAVCAWPSANERRSSRAAATELIRLASEKWSFGVNIEVIISPCTRFPLRGTTCLGPAEVVRLSTLPPRLLCVCVSDGAPTGCCTRWRAYSQFFPA